MMTRTELLQGIRMMRFEEAYRGWTEKVFNQEEAARLLGVSDRTFRRYLIEYKEQGLNGLIDYRLNQISHRRAPVDEIVRLIDLYRTQYGPQLIFLWLLSANRDGSGKAARVSKPLSELHQQGHY